MDVLGRGIESRATGWFARARTFADVLWSSWLTLADASCTLPSRAIRPRRGPLSDSAKRSHGTRHLDIYSATAIMRSASWRQP